MSTAIVPTWRLAAESFLPERAREKLGWVISHAPLLILLIMQALFSLRLENSAFQDEALYIYTGHWLIDSWRSGAEVFSHPESFFSGAPYLYPVFAALLDSLGGLGLVRFFSCLCMLSNTVAIYWTTNLLFRHRPGVRPGILAAAVFALSAPVIFLGKFATFDAPAFTMMAWAMALIVWTIRTQKSVWWAVLAGGLLALAVLTKYSSAIDAPFVLVLGLLAAMPTRRGGLIALQRAFTAGATALLLLAASALTWAAPLVAGLSRTTTQRVDIDRMPIQDLLWDVAVWSGPTFVLMLVGGAYLAMSRPGLALVMTSGTLAAVLYQSYMGEPVSLHKHIVLGLLIGAPLAGLLLSRLLSVKAGGLIVAGLLWMAYITSMYQSEKLFDVWPNTDDLASEVKYSVDAMPWIRILGEIPEPVQYKLMNETEPWQFVSTYEGSFRYTPRAGGAELSDVAAYDAALEDNYFQLVFLDGATPVGRNLIPQMEAFGFERTSVVNTPYTGHKWMIWQRHDNIPE
jgi:hypothetical protein